MVLVGHGGESLNPSTCKAEAVGLQVQGQSDLHSKTLSNFQSPKVLFSLI
jgi:hypothetical protein